MFNFPKFSKEDILRGPISKSLFFLAFPLVTANLFQITYQLVDIFWIGRLGSEALAALAYSLPVTFLVISLGGGIVAAGTILISQHKGAKNQREIDYTAGQTISFLAIFSLIVFLGGFFATPFLLRLLGASEEIFPMAQSYIQTVFSGTILIFGFTLMRNFFRGMGDSVTSMWIALLSTAINLVLDPILIFGWGFFPRMEVQGAAVATMVSRGIGAFIGITILLKGRSGINIIWKYLKPDFSFFKKIARIGFPISLESSAKPIGAMAILPVVSSFGVVTVAAYGVTNTFINLIFVISLGMSQALNTVVAQNLGASQFLRARAAAFKAGFFGFVFFLFLGLIMFWQAEFLTGIFTSEPQVQMVATQFLRIVSLSFGFFGFMRLLTGAFRGGGSTLASMGITVTTIIVFLISLVTIFSKLFGQVGIWWAFFVSYVSGGILSFLWLSFARWQKRLVGNETKIEEISA